MTKIITAWEARERQQSSQKLKDERLKSVSDAIEVAADKGLNYVILSQISSRPEFVLNFMTPNQLQQDVMNALKEHGYRVVVEDENVEVYNPYDEEKRYERDYFIKVYW